MKRIFCLILLAALPLVFGCSTGGGGNGGVTKHTTFAGVTLGQTLTQVESVLGPGTNPSTVLGITYYSFSSDTIICGFQNPLVYIPQQRN